MEDLRGGLDAGHTVIENERHNDHTYHRRTTRTLAEHFFWNLKRAEVGEREEEEKGGLEEATEVQRESSEEHVADDKKQETGERARHQETETEQEEPFPDLKKTPGLRKEVCRKGEKAMKEEGESKTGGEEIPRTQAEREETERSAAAQAARAPIPNETARSTSE